MTTRYLFPLDEIGMSKMSTETICLGRPMGIEVSVAFLGAGGLVS